jgi:hypothetical protein
MTNAPELFDSKGAERPAFNLLPAGFFAMKTRPRRAAPGDVIVVQPCVIEEGGFRPLLVALAPVWRLVEPCRRKGEHLDAFVGDAHGVFELGR